MKHYYELDESDIRQALADHYNCDKKDIELQVHRVSAGYGPGEHLENRVMAKITASDGQIKICKIMSSWGGLVRTYENPSNLS